MKKKEKKNKERSHMLRGLGFMLAQTWQASPGTVILHLSTNIYFEFYYSVIQGIWFLRAAVNAIEGGAGYGRFLLLLLAVVAAKGLADIIEHWYYNKQHEYNYLKVERHVFTKLHQKLASVELSCYENPDFYNRIERAARVMQDEMFRGAMYELSNFIVTPLLLLVTGGYIVSVERNVLFFAFAPVLTLLIKLFSNKLDYKRDKEMTPYKRQQDYVRRTVFLKDFAKEIKTGGMFAVLTRRYEEATERKREIIKKYGIRVAALEILANLVGDILPIAGALLYICWRFVKKQDLPLADFAVLFSAINKFKNSLGYLEWSFSWLHKNSQYMWDLRTFLRYEPKLQSGTRTLPTLETLELRNVSFAYGEEGEQVLRDVSFTLKKGEKIAVVGHNGAGKTTLAKLLLRLYDVSEGEILYNGIPIAQYGLEDYRKAFATVFQDYQIFALPVAENVLMREYDEAKDAARVQEALQFSGVQEKIDSLSKGMDALLTKEFDDAGAVLSGGEGQKLAISRLFAKESGFEIALLDEPSSALDPVAEAKMYDNLMSATAGETVVYISHRLSSAVLCDRVLVFDGGRLSEQGSHAALMAAGGQYAEMFTMQAENYRDEEGSDVE